MGVINKKAKTTNVYTITIEEIKELIAADLEIPVDEINISDIQKDTTDHMDRYPSQQFDGIKVIHKPN